MAAPLVLWDAGLGAPTPKAATEVMRLYRLILLPPRKCLAQGAFFAMPKPMMPVGWLQRILPDVSKSGGEEGLSCSRGWTCC